MNQALFEAINNKLSDETIWKLEEYTSNISKVADELDHENNLWDKNLIEIYSVLDRVDKLIDDIFN